MHRSRQLINASLIVILLFAFSKVTGFGKLLLMTDLFGAGPEADAFVAANQLPELFWQMIAAGALAAALIPVYSASLNDGRRTAESRMLAHTVVTLVLLVLGGVCGLAALFAPWVTRVVLVPDFPPAQQQLTADLMRVVLVSMTIVGLSGAYSALLNAHQHFALPALSTVVIDIGQIVGLWLLAPRMGIMGAAWGSVIGALLHLAVQLPAIAAFRIGFQPRLALHLAGVRELIRLMGPRVITIGAVQASDLFLIRIASGLPAGSVSGYFYALLVIGLPSTLFAWAIGTVVFPTMAEQYNTGARETLRQTATQTLRVLWLLLLPGAVGLLALGRPGVAFLFERGAFDGQATDLIYTLLVILAFRVVADSSLVVLERLFYARHDTRTPMWGYLLWFIVQVGGAYILTGLVGVRGLALAHVAAFLLLVVFLYWRNRLAMGGLGERQLAATGGRALLAAGLMAGAIALLHRLPLTPTQFVLLALPVGTAVYLVFVWFMEGRALLGAFRASLRELPA